MAEYLSIPERNLYEVDERIADEHAVFTEPLAAAYEIIEQIHTDPSRRILVLGDGKLAQLISRLFYSFGFSITVQGKHKSKPDLLNKLGIDTFISGQRPQQLFSTVIEATGSSSGPEHAIRCVEPRGTLVLKSTIAGNQRFDLSAIVINEISLIGSRCVPFKTVLHILATGQLKPEDLISRVMPITEAEQAFNPATAKNSPKVLLKIT